MAVIIIIIIRQSTPLSYSRFCSAPSRDRTKWAQMAPKGAKDGLLGALVGSKQGRNGLNMPRTLSPSGRDHFWTKAFLTIFGPKIHLSGVPCGGVLPPPPPLARPGTGSYAGVGAVLRGGNHLNWGVAPRKSAPGIAIPAVQPEIRPFFGFGPPQGWLGGWLCPPPLARPGTGSYAGVGAVLRGGNQEEELGDVYIADTGKGRAGLEDFNFDHEVRRKVGAEWGPMSETKEYLKQHVQP